MEEKWQAPWQYEWEQQPDAPFPAAPPVPPRPLAPPPTPWEPPVTPPPPPGRRARRAAMVIGGLTGFALLGALLATCGPSGRSTGELVTAPVSGSPGPSGEASAALDPTAAAATGSVSPSASSSPSPSPSPSTAPDVGPTTDPGTDPGTAAAASGDESDRQPEQTRTPRQHGRPGPAAPPHPRPHPARPSNGTPGNLFPSLKVCSEAERLGEWAPGSEQAKLCRSLYGS
ncbi:hypothetical protein ACFC1R_04745 [Kitasatospora sp. NPDC056138]|uniref:hypothetical protein n=1 Tax=Kitasatospora sp. NPDC056138 TaxID=3345724 RepID=UPI0035DFAF8B